MQVADYSNKINREVDPAKIAAGLHFSIDSVMGWLDTKLFKAVEAWRVVRYIQKHAVL
jgi:hypothetical protein